MPSENTVYTVIRYLFFTFNFVIWILGIAIFGVGIYTRVVDDVYEGLASMDAMVTAANLLIAAGLFVSVLGFLGCCGAIKRWQWMLLTYSSVILLILILEIAAIAYASTKWQKVEKRMMKAVKDGITNSYSKGDKKSVAIKTAIDLFQTQVQCCGAAGPMDWKNSYWYRNQNSTLKAQVPKSCCRKDNLSPTCNIGVNANSTTIYNDGCIAAGKAYALSNMKVMVDVGVGIALIEIGGIIFAMLLCNFFRKEDGGELHKLVNH